MAKLRRQYILWLNPELILVLLGNWKRYQCLTVADLQLATDEKGNRVAIPEDVELLSVYADWQRRSFGVQLQHDSFPEVEDGALTPSLRLLSWNVQRLPDVVRPDFVTDALGET